MQANIQDSISGYPVLEVGFLEINCGGPDFLVFKIAHWLCGACERTRSSNNPDRRGVYHGC